MPYNYLLCATPRTGSTLLCQYLYSSTVAGNPQSYFRTQDMPAYAKEWQIVDAKGAYTFHDYLNSVRRESKTENGVMGVRIMWGSFDQILPNLKHTLSNLPDNDSLVLEQAFGPLKYIYLYRQNIVAQAISLYRAKQTNFWHSVEQRPSSAEPAFNFDAINALVQLISQHHLAWRNWFSSEKITPLKISYESLAENPHKSVESLLRFIDVKRPTNIVLQAQNQRLADGLTKMWLTQYRTIAADLSDQASRRTKE